VDSSAFSFTQSPVVIGPPLPPPNAPPPPPLPPSPPPPSLPPSPPPLPPPPWEVPSPVAPPPDPPSSPDSYEYESGEFDEIVQGAQNQEAGSKSARRDGRVGLLSALIPTGMLSMAVCMLCVYYTARFRRRNKKASQSVEGKDVSVIIEAEKGNGGQIASFQSVSETSSVSEGPSAIAFCSTDEHGEECEGEEDVRKEVQVLAEGGIANGRNADGQSVPVSPGEARPQSAPSSPGRVPEGGTWFPYTTPRALPDALPQFRSQIQTEIERDVSGRRSPVQTAFSWLEQVEEPVLCSESELSPKVEEGHQPARLESRLESLQDSDPNWLDRARMGLTRTASVARARLANNARRQRECNEEAETRV